MIRKYIEYLFCVNNLYTLINTNNAEISGKLTD